MLNNGAVLRDPAPKLLVAADLVLHLVLQAGHQLLLVVQKLRGLPFIDVSLQIRPAMLAGVEAILQDGNCKVPRWPPSALAQDITSTCFIKIRSFASTLASSAGVS